MKKGMKQLLLIVISGIVSIVIAVLLCNAVISHNTEGQLFSSVDSVPQYDVGLLLGTTPQTRIARRPNPFFKYRIDAADALYKAGKIKNILISGDENSLDGINEV